ncbi:MAG: A24 family peptidase [Janthinobacterium lividum]
MSVSPELIYVEGAFACATAAAVTDLKSRRIPNWLTGSSLCLGLCLHLLLGGVRDAGLAFLAGLAAGGVFFLLFAAGGMGAGDVKLIAAVCSLGGMHAMPNILLSTVLLGAVAAVLTALAKGRLHEMYLNLGLLLTHHQVHGLETHPQLNVRNHSLLRLPYAVPVAAGCLATLLVTLHGGLNL